jgi:hypothetical protein
LPSPVNPTTNTSQRKARSPSATAAGTEKESTAAGRETGAAGRGKAAAVVKTVVGKKAADAKKDDEEEEEEESDDEGADEDYDWGEDEDSSDDGKGGGSSKSKPPTCKECPGRVFKTIGEFNMHNCVDAKLFECKICSEELSSKELLVAHVTAVHPEKRPSYNFFWKDMKTDRELHYTLDIGMMTILKELKVFDRASTKMSATFPALWQRLYNEKTGLLKDMSSRVSGPLRAITAKDTKLLTTFMSKMKMRMAETYVDLNLGSQQVVFNEGTHHGRRNSSLKTFCEEYLSGVLDDVYKKKGLSTPTSGGGSGKKRAREDDGGEDTKAKYGRALLKRENLDDKVNELAAREHEKGKKKLSTAEKKELERLRGELEEAKRKVHKYKKRMNDEQNA